MMRSLEPSSVQVPSLGRRLLQGSTTIDTVVDRGISGLCGRRNALWLITCIAVLLQPVSMVAERALAHWTAPPVLQIQELSPITTAQTWRILAPLYLREGIDLDTPRMVTGLAADLFLTCNRGTACSRKQIPTRILPGKGVSFRLVEVRLNAPESCYSGTYAQRPIPLKELSSGDGLCVRTNGGQVAFSTLVQPLRSTADLSLSLDVTIWHSDQPMRSRAPAAGPL
jgi:hypothetical protein